MIWPRCYETVSQTLELVPTPKLLQIVSLAKFGVSNHQADVDFVPADKMRDVSATVRWGECFLANELGNELN